MTSPKPQAPSSKENGHRPQSRAAAIRAARLAAAADREIEFPLPATGGTALVRRLDLMELIALDAIPATLQAVVNDLLESQLGDDASASTTDVMRALGGPLVAIQKQYELADALCLVGFVDPRLVPTADDVTDPETELALEDIARADRMAYWTWCQGATEAVALAPSFPQPAAAAAPGPAEPAVRDAPVDVSTGPPLSFDADAAVLAFGATYEAEMGKLPAEASELTREMRHRELLGLDDEADGRTDGQADGELLDVAAIIGRKDS